MVLGVGVAVVPAVAFVVVVVAGDSLPTTEYPLF